MKKPQPPTIIADDLPADWIEFQMRGRPRDIGEIWSRPAALQRADAARRNPNQHHPHDRPLRGRAVR